jgi:hypothetical protein
MTSVVFAAEEKPAPAAPPAAPAPIAEVQPQGRDSKWRLLLDMGFGNLSARSSNGANAIENDYKNGGGGAFGVLTDYRPSPKFGMVFGLKLMATTVEAETGDLGLTLAYLALPLEARFRITPLFKRSQLFAKAGLTYLLLLSADVGTGKSERERGDWDDDWDAYPSPPTKGSYRGSFVKSNWLASAGIGADFLLFQIKDSFNMSLVPQVTYYRSLNNISKSGEFTGPVYLQGFLTGLSVAAGF